MSITSQANQAQTNQAQATPDLERPTLRVALAQIKLTLGAVAANTQRVIAAVQANPTADLMVFPELTLTGCPLEDLVIRPDLSALLAESLDLISAQSYTTAILVGYPEITGQTIYNAASVFYRGQRIAHYRKQRLANAAGFDEYRHFSPGTQSCVFDFKGHRIGVLLGQDILAQAPLAAAKSAGAQLIVSAHADGYAEHIVTDRMQVLQQRVAETQLPIIWVNHIGGQDELIFDGNSLVVDERGQVALQLAHCQEDTQQLEIVGGKLPSENRVPTTAKLDDIDAQTYQALVLALHDYVEKNGFEAVLLGLSGGIDSALALAIAVDAIGAERIRAVMMPYQYTADISIEDAQLQADWLGCAFDIVPIAPLVAGFMDLVPQLATSTSQDTTEENLQARCRGVLLMALSNKERRLLLTTSNKSELAVGYCTLYGDMCGGFGPLKDVYKERVYALARYRNSLSMAIPERVITRPPSAELAPDQKDADSLPAYPVLDAIIEGYAEHDKSIADLINAGYDELVVKRIVRLIELNEYKRRQGAIGPKVTRRNFGQSRRYPITSQYLNAMLEQV